MSISITKLYVLLDIKVGRETVENPKASNLATKEDILATKKEIAEFKAELIKWMFIFLFGQMVTTFGIIAVFMKK
jgi:hypothetical protein